MIVYGQLLLSLVVVIHVSLDVGVDGAELNPFGFVGANGRLYSKLLIIGHLILFFYYHIIYDK